ncbi:hypothetical protein SEUCBS139899_005534 [Sporothrix eucalyptigena]|uniref:Transcription factor domain-containing protein n=1 Tax=Sporothrix eucalyptigena TaxID=1812306 RepID=A0ABP0D0M7_9PEZI
MHARHAVAALPPLRSVLDPASILILDKLNQVLFRLDNVSPAAASNSPEKTLVGASPGFPPLQDDDRSQNPLRFPPARTTADAILKWPIFENRYPPDYITDALFLAEAPDEGSDADADDCPSPLSSRRRQNSKIRSRVVDEDAIPGLVQRFIDLVHIKNPILDVDVIWALTRRVVDDGFVWNMESCLVLIAAALGCVAQPFGSAVFSAQGISSLEAHADALQQGEAYYYMARRRLGLLDRGIRVTQCHFLVGVYLMYTMRPLSAWSQFRTASESYRIYLECKARYLPTAQQLDPGKASKRRLMEQRLYWSCYKSECEMRSEINLPDSLLADCEYPDMHPSPPDAPSPVPGDTTDGNIPASWNRSRPAWLRRRHEQSWFYYLTDITLRRIINRILNIMYVGDHATWTAEAIPFLAKTAEEFERQLEEWYVPVFHNVSNIQS